MLPNPEYNKFFMADSAIDLVKSGKIAESLVDDKVRRILRVMIKTKNVWKTCSGFVQYSRASGNST